MISKQTITRSPEKNLHNNSFELYTRWGRKLYLLQNNFATLDEVLELLF